MSEPLRLCFVCLGNICRSPTAAAVMRHLVAEAGLGERVEVESAGTGDWQVGNPADPRSAEVAGRRGYDLSGHRARQLARRDLERFDLVLVMDAENLADVRRLAGPDGAEHVVPLRSFDPEAGDDLDVPDPYTGGPEGFDLVLEQVERACRGLLDHVRDLLAA